MRAEFYVQTGSAYENPYGVPHDQLDRMRETEPAEVVAQVIFGKFVEMSGLVFTSEIANELFDNSMQKVLDNFWMDKGVFDQYATERRAGRSSFYRFAHGIDLARKKDFTVIFVIDTEALPRPRVVYYHRLNRVPWAHIYAAVGKALWLFPGEQLMDGTGSGGDVVYDEISSRVYCVKHDVTFEANSTCSKAGRKGGCIVAGDDFRPAGPIYLRMNPQTHQMTAASKVQLINHLQMVMAQGYDKAEPGDAFGGLRCPPIQQLQDEIAEYAWDDKKLSTDCVMALALATLLGIEMQPGIAAYGSAYGT